MDSEVNVYRSLPPLVEGKLQGYLKLAVDEVLWSRRSPGDVTVIASWWGEIDSAQFRPVDVQTGLLRPDKDTVETYAVRTNVELFVEYLKNCETIELVVISEETHRVLGTAHVVDLLDILKGKNYSRYFPILNESGNRLGDIHVGVGFMNMTKNFKSSRRMRDLKKPPFEDQISYTTGDIEAKYNGNKLQTRNKNIFDHKLVDILAQNNTKYGDNIYQSVLKEKYTQEEIPSKKLNMEVTDKLVAQVVARAQRLRGAILEESQNNDPLALSETSVLDSSRSDISADNEAKLYEYFLGKKMSRFDERKALETLRSTSPTPSLIDLAAETIKSCQPSSKQHSSVEKIVADKQEKEFDDALSKDSVSSKSQESSPRHQIDSMKIIVGSMTLSPAGYRRVQSSRVSRGDSVPLAVTYFVEYDTSFTQSKKSMKKSNNDHRPTKLCSKKQVGQVIYFNHQAIFDLPKSCIQMDIPLKFKVFNRHLNQRTPALLGLGTIFINEVAETETLSTTQKLAIVNKGIKMGELKVNVELGCDGIHFGRDFVDAVTSTKQNIPVYEISSIPSTTETKIRSATGSHSKPNSRVSTSSKYSYSCGGSKSSGRNKNIGNEQKQNNMEDRYVKVDQPDDNKEEKILLHGLIYIAEGKGLPKLNTYLICRAFWREDRATSQLCSNTENPLYHFHEMVPLLHGQDLLDRTKDNFIITEVWNRSVGGPDNLIGFAKLPVHQLYIAYRDPLVVPHLLMSKYPVISVDGWVPISEPGTGRLCGELLALVALGTADQIALLEMTRGLRDCSITPRAIKNSLRDSSQNTAGVSLECQNVNQRVQSSYDILESSSNLVREVDERNFGHSQTMGNICEAQNTKTQESQTEITTVEDLKSSNILNQQSQNLAAGSQNSVLHALVDHLAQALNVPKSGGHSTTEIRTVDPKHQKISDNEQIDSDPMSNDSVSSSESSPRENCNVPTEIYRSVGVGAEFDETVNQVPSTSYPSSNLNQASKEKLILSNEPGNTLRHIDDELSFRAHIEIECALHLPKIEKPDGPVEPSTYVTFQPVQMDNGSQFGPYKVTNIFPNSSSPKWEWRCDTRLSSDLLVNDQKRMILKIWRLSDAAINSNLDLDKDIVIGFAAVDLSVLLAGFPLISGWFHIMDFTGKCNGQIKVTITPLENIAMFVKSNQSGMSIQSNQTAHLATTCCIPQTPNAISQTSIVSAESVPPIHVANNTDGFSHSYSQLENDPGTDIGLGLGDVSMTFLSQSLKQKLTELDEITKRLKSRLHDVTNEDFDVDFDPDFDANEPELELERNQNGNGVNEHSSNVTTPHAENWQPLPPATNNSSSQSSQINRHQDSNFFNDIQNRYAPNNFFNTNTESTEPNLTDTGYSTNSHVQSTQSLSNGHFETENQNGHYFSNGYSNDHVADQPVRGAKMHINHLLDKLTSLTSAPPTQTGNFPIKRNIHDFIASLRYNSIHNHGKCNQEVNYRTVPTQTEDPDMQRSDISKNETLPPINLQLRTTIRDVNENNNVDRTSPNNQTEGREKVSTLIREELVTEENNDTTEFDDLTAHLLTSNVRHMDFDTIFNPLLYQHLIPDVQISNSLSNQSNSLQDIENLNSTSNGVMIEELDNRYAETFNATINNGLGRLRNLIEIDASQIDDEITQNRVQTSSSKSFEGTELFRMTPTGVSDDIDGNIDVTVADKPSNDDLMASNSTESTTTLSFDTSSIRQRQEIVDNVSLISSDSSVSVVTRQAPDGGNPTEENNKPVVMGCQNESENSSSDS